jgi:hypothetical protein
MSDRPAGRHTGPGQYEIRLKGRLGSRWAAWFDGLSIAHSSDGTTTMHGQVADQAALYGLLQKARDLGLPLISVTPIEPGHPGHPSPPTAGTR